MKVHIWPGTAALPVNNGIGRVVHAQYRGLPRLGIELVTPERADVIACHTQQADLPRIDVLHCHGAYWSGDPNSGVYKAWHHHANAEIVKAARRSRYITVPSDWVGGVFRRDMRINPVVIGHGIDFESWSPGVPDGYVLWNKNRSGDVCDPTPAWELARRGINVISTFGPDKPYLPNFKVTGAMSEELMHPLVQNAQIYLATTKETFGIGTLEAMACGVPVLGFRHGGTAQLVTHGENGYLAEPYDYDSLAEGVRYIEQNWQRLSVNARVVAKEYSWERVMEQYAQLYDLSLRSASADVPMTTIVITAYNYGQYVGEAIESALNQTLPCHVVVVNDGSNDDTLQQIRKYTGRVDKIIDQPNQGVAAARNAGIAEAFTDFVVCLDADDKLDPRYVEVLQKAMMDDRGLGIAYSGLATIRENRLVPNEWPPEFQWEGMARPGNPPPSCIPCAAMFRKRMWERAGGYRQQFAPAEDTEFWVRGLSVGFTAQRVTEDMLFHYRLHTGSASRTKQYHPISAGFPWMSDNQYPFAAPAKNVPAVRSYSNPAVSVIIPVGANHWKYLPDALESLLAQSLREWEVIVVRDGDAENVDKLLAPYPFVNLVEGNGRGPGAARNIGLDAAVAPMCLFLDADDYLAPEALKQFVATYAQRAGQYVYSDWIAVQKGQEAPQTCPDYDVSAILSASQHAVTVLMSTEAARKIQFNETLTVLEDWEFFIRCAISGMTGYHLSAPLLYARTESGSRTKSRTKHQKTVDKIYAAYDDYRQGRKTLMGCCGNDNKAALAAAQLVQRQGLEVQNNMPDMQAFDPNLGEVRMAFIGTNTGSIPYGGPGVTPSGRTYRGANNIFDKYVNADPRDVAWLQGLGVWQIVANISAPLPSVPALKVEDPDLIPTAPAISVSAPHQLSLFTEEEVAKPVVVEPAEDEPDTALLDVGPAPISEEQALREIQESIVKAPPGRGRRQR